MSTERTRSLDMAQSTLATVSTLLDLIDWEWLREEQLRAETLGPILAPTEFRNASQSGRLHSNRKVIDATIAYLRVLREVVPEGVS